jgi:acylphosphatase
MPRERRRVYYSGRVQGVGFRFTCQRLATGFDVDGYVRNLDDRRVEVVVEGEPAVCDAFLEAVHNGLGHHIREVCGEALTPGDPPIAGFSIRY